MDSSLGRMARNARVSVAMATCEGARFIDEQLESLAAQTLPPHELVVCDDASGDATCSRVRAFAERAPFEVRLHENASRLGTTRNFEKATALCAGEIIFMADQDDVWHPEKIERLVSIFEADPRVGVAFCNGQVVDGERQPLGYDLWSAVGFTAGEQALARNGRAAEVFLRHVVAAGATLAFRSSHLPLVLPFPDLRSAHDAWVAFMIAAVARCAILDERLIEHRLHADNQFGFKLFDLKAQYEQAKVQVREGAFAYARTFFAAARDRFDAQLDCAQRPSAQLETRIEGKIAHADLRDGMSPRLVERVGPILSELVRGRYRRYSYGWKSVGQDLFLR